MSPRSLNIRIALYAGAIDVVFGFVWTRRIRLHAVKDVDFTTFTRGS
ncbi:MAG TPA: hypothetical protein VGK91_06745 [Candidatus Udaeobacter sp.]